ncbi:MAG: CDP-glucose 4,6-dehydratase [Promethearchaeota archaeon]
MNNLYGTFFQDKIILLTGHTGFIGSWLTILLNELDAKVIGYALPPLTQNDNFVLSKLDQKIESNIGDIRDYKKLLKIVEKSQPDIIYHLAAQPIVRKSYSIPKETYDINVGGTINIIESFKNSETAKCLINFTTDKCYENLEQKRGYKETDRLGGYDPYSSSKACSELITLAYRNSFFNPENSNKIKNISSIRCGNVFGGGDWQEDRLIPDLMKAIKQKIEFNVRNPESIRPWQFVLEALRGLLTLTKRMWSGDTKYSGAWNFGPDAKSFLTVKELVKKILNYLNLNNYSVKYIAESGLHETKVLLLNTDKARTLLGWKPELDIDNSIKLLSDWYMEEEVDYNFNVKQIKNYFKIITS